MVGQARTAPRNWMRLLGRWHIWLGWLVGVPLLMWTITGLVMVARPIEEVRGEHLRKPPAAATLPSLAPLAIRVPPRADVEMVMWAQQDGAPVATVTYADGGVQRFDADGRALAALDEATARALVARDIVGGERVVSTRFFAAEDVPVAFRRPMPVWQVALADGTHVYVGQQTGKIEAVRTRFWRVFDIMWGLHIMDLREREDTHHPLLVLFAALAAGSVLIGCVLLFRRRRAAENARPAS